MNHSEAIYCLKAESELYPEVCNECELYGKVGCDHCFDEAADIAIEALKKQIPQKTNTVVQNKDVKIGSVRFIKGTKVHHCPECNMTVTCSDHFCRNCGQALIW